MKGEYGCLMLGCDFKSWDKCLALIPDNFVYDDEGKNYGKTQDPHVTVLFGFHKDSTKVEDIKKHIMSLNKPLHFNIVGLSKFDNPKFTVLKFDVESDELKELNKYFADNFEHTNEHKVYHAHITVCYVKKDCLDKLPPDTLFSKPYVLKSDKFKYNDGDIKEFFTSVSKKTVLKEDTQVQMGNLGTISYNQVLSPDKQRDLFITDLEIHPKYRGQGKFKDFLSQVITYVKNKGYKNIILEPDITKGRENTKFLTDLYTKYGFKPVVGDESLMSLSL